MDGAVSILSLTHRMEGFLLKSKKKMLTNLINDQEHFLCRSMHHLTKSDQPKGKSICPSKGLFFPFRHVY